MADESTAPAPQAPQSPVAALKAYFTAQADPAKEEAEAPKGGVARTAEPSEEPAQQAKPDTEESATREDAETEETETDEVPEENDAADVEVQLSTLKDLAEATDLELERLLDLTLPTKIDGKEGTARIRDLLRSYQLDGHINQKLATIDNDRKAFETRRLEAEQAAAERLKALDQGLAVLDRALQGELASVNWGELQAADPSAFNSKYVEYQQRFGQLQTIAAQIQAEKDRQSTELQSKAKEWAEDQRRLLKAKVPEWSDDTKRAQDKAAIVEYLKGHGITSEEFDTLQDHRYALVIRDAWKWGELQKSKPATLKKVKAAPKVLKPGVKQSREAKDSLVAKEEVARLRRTGRPADAAAVLKRQLFGTRG